MRRHEKPLKRTNPSGKTVWVARWTDRSGKRRAGWPPEIPGTYGLQREAQDAIDACYDKEAAGDLRSETTVGSYFSVWLDRHPRSDRTERSYKGRVKSVLDVSLSGRKFRDWPMAEVNGSHAVDIVDDLLRRQGRAASGARGVIVVLSAMWKDAMLDLKAPANPFSAVRVRASDRRVRKPPRRIRTYSFEQMHALAKAAAMPVADGKQEELSAWRAAVAEPMIRVLSDCGVRLGELLPIEAADYHLDAVDAECPSGPHLHLRTTAHEGRTHEHGGTKNDHGEVDAGRVVPVAPTLEVMLSGLGQRFDTPLLFPSPTGRLWRESNWYRDVWRPARKEVRGMEAATPHSFRHSWVSHMRAKIIDPAHLAQMAGHTVETATAHYTHAVGDSFADVRDAIG